MCNNVIVYVIDSTYSNERNLIGVLTVLGEERGRTGDFAVNTNSRCIPLQLRHRRIE